MYIVSHGEVIEIDMRKKYIIVRGEILCMDISDEVVELNEILPDTRVTRLDKAHIESEWEMI